MKEGGIGAKIPAVAEYDPTGLRATPTATWKALDEAVQKNALPNHLPQPEWWDHYEEIAKERERKGLPVAFGRRYQEKYISSNYNQIRW